ncbi:GNAT family N-acetyltransferase [Hyphomicrobium sp. LHD-15]|uniref:GNAT family N-acetyltransferase n=1 Tax=Hyphomicrobium sp. LHD-15 TaxID=3072142 RepID=UPI00280D8F31|nr:GNAT family N-acetyltransferase [Hyphomicrobium sp. LHD-15]MDQ8698301.1 GNAT family N-acetyltransferase [Hyphomicrobium sp. LHD-15]
MVVKVVPSLRVVAADAWDACANPDAATHNPFVSHAFLSALETAGAVGPGTGWTPQHLVLEGADGDLLGVMPLYAKTHSQGEYVFDHAWADALHRVGGAYYPKLQGAVPFTPVPGRRFLARPGPMEAERERLLAHAAIALADRLGVSSVHVTFLTEGEWTRLAGDGYLQRTGQQFHWRNEGYRTFDDFLATLSSRKRKAIRKERADAQAAVEIFSVTGSEIMESHWDAFFSFYMDTGSRKWGRPYLNRAFFSMLGQALPERCLLIFARRAGRIVAGALNLVGGDCLYGRYWGAIEHHPFLHFELCYYQAIDYAIAHGLARAEAGAQGEHKLARGYLPETTYSLHWLADPRLEAAVARYLAEERSEVSEINDLLRAHGPFKKDGGGS